MENLLERFLNEGLGQVIDVGRRELLAKDEIYQTYETELAEKERCYEKLDLPEEQRAVVGDYISCLHAADSRYADISYMAGVKATIQLFSHLGLIKE